MNHQPNMGFQSLVVISSTVASTDVKTKFRDVAVPVVTWRTASTTI